MWFVILKTLVPGQDSGTGSSQPEMLLVADDANAAYSNPRVLPKRADFPAVYRFSLPHRRRSERRHVKRSSRIIQTALAPLVWTLTSVTWDIGVRTSPALGKATRVRGPPGHRVTATRTTTTTPRTAPDTATSKATATGATRSRSRGSTPSTTPMGSSRPTVRQPGTSSRPGTTSRAGTAISRRPGPPPGTARPTTASRTLSGSPSRATACPAAARVTRRRTTATASRAVTRRATGAAAATRPCPTGPTDTRGGTPGTTGTAGSPPPRPAPASLTRAPTH